MKPHIRWQIRRDLPEVIEIENYCFPDPWQAEDFLRCLRLRHCIGMVAEIKESVIGFMVYELHTGYLHLLRLAVHPKWQRRGIGSAMVAKLVGKLSTLRRRELTVDVRESNLDALLFFRSQGFLAIDMKRGFYEDTGEDAIQMVATCPEQVQWPATEEVQ
jgi:ribosomal-protein-alanine N-acetyltransferase